MPATVAAAMDLADTAEAATHQAATAEAATHQADTEEVEATELDPDTPEATELDPAMVEATELDPDTEAAATAVDMAAATEWSATLLQKAQSTVVAMEEATNAPTIALLRYSSRPCCLHLASATVICFCY